MPRLNPTWIKDGPSRWRSKLIGLSAERKACLLVLGMGVIGAGFGAISANFELKRCPAISPCAMQSEFQKRLDDLQLAAFAGMGSGLLVSVPHLWRHSPRQR